MARSIQGGGRCICHGNDSLGGISLTSLHGVERKDDADILVCRFDQLGPDDRDGIARAGDFDPHNHDMGAWLVRRSGYGLISGCDDMGRPRHQPDPSLDVLAGLLAGNYLIVLERVKPMETLSKLYLELSHVVPKETKNYRDIFFEQSIKNALNALDGATPRQRNGPVYRAADILRSAIGLPPLNIGENPSSGL